MGIAELLDGRRTREAEVGQRFAPGGYAGKVYRAPASTTARLLVTIDAFAEDKPWEARWMPRPAAHAGAASDPGGELPVKGDLCLVMLDDEGEAWVPVVWPKTSV